MMINILLYTASRASPSPKGLSYCNQVFLLSEALSIITTLHTISATQIYTTLIFPFQKQNNKVKLHQVAKLYSNIHTIQSMATVSVFQKFNFQGPPLPWTIEENGPQCHQLQYLSRN